MQRKRQGAAAARHVPLGVKIGDFRALASFYYTLTACKRFYLPSDAAYWQGRYAAGRDGWDTRGITPPLRAYFDQLDVARQPRILIPGAGRAYEAEYLHQLASGMCSWPTWPRKPLAALAARVPDFPAATCAGRLLCPAQRRRPTI